MWLPHEITKASHMGGCQNWGYMEDNGKENGNYYNRVVYWGYMGDNGKENGNYYNGLV